MFAKVEYYVPRVVLRFERAVEPQNMFKLYLQIVRRTLQEHTHTTLLRS